VDDGTVVLAVAAGAGACALGSGLSGTTSAATKAVAQLPVNANVASAARAREERRVTENTMGKICGHGERDAVSF